VTVLKIHPANYLHLYTAALDLAPSDREEMDRMESGRDPVDVLTASDGDKTLMAITDDLDRVMAVGGHDSGIIWFVHTNAAENLNAADKRQMLRMLSDHFTKIKLEALSEKPEDDFHFTNYVSEANKKHLKLLRALGATFAREPTIFNGNPFRQFFM
jgi:hypothetical protein